MTSPPQRDPRSETPAASAGFGSALSRVEWIVGISITLAAVCLHVVYWQHAGGLWRDETNAVHMAAFPTLSEIWQMLTRESSPILPFLVIRAWVALGFGESDIELRGLGLGIGLLLLASLWIAARLMRRGVPVVSLALLALNVTVIRSGDSLRAYGLGSALIILALASMWRFVQRPTRRSAALAALAAVSSVQCLYQNAFFVLAAACGACAVCARERQWRKALSVVGIGAAAALSLLPYIPTIVRSQDFFVLARTGFEAAEVWKQASTAMGSPVAWFTIVWVLLVLLAIGTGLTAIQRNATASSTPEHDSLILCAAAAMVVGIAGFVSFLHIAGFQTRAWYYIPVLAFLAVCLDALLPKCHRWARATLVMFAAPTVLTAYPLGLPAMHCRQTNLDLAAELLNRDAAAQDFILVHPFYVGATFQRYYKGGTPWATLPPLEDYYVQRYDLLKVKMQMEDPIQPVLDKVAATLQSGGSVWLVGWIPLHGAVPADMRPAPNNPWGWLEWPYSRIWAAKAGYLIASHAEQSVEVLDLSTDCVNPVENMPVRRVAGWRPKPPAITPN